MIVKGGFVHVAFALIKRITIVYDLRLRIRMLFLANGETGRE